jgi:hypothetical protein
MNKAIAVGYFYCTRAVTIKQLGTCREGLQDSHEIVHFLAAAALPP